MDQPSLAMWCMFVNNKYRSALKWSRVIRTNGPVDKSNGRSASSSLKRVA
jgi:hypothetical protein